MFIPALGPIRSPDQWVSKLLFLGINQPGYEAVHIRPSSAKVRMSGAIPHPLNTS